MIKTWGNGRPNDLNGVLLDIRDFGFPNWQDSTLPDAPTIVTRIGGLSAAVRGNDTKFWSYASIQQSSVYPQGAGQLYMGHSRQRPQSRTDNSGFALYAPYVAAPIGFDPASDINLQFMPKWPVHEFEVTIAKASAAGFMLVSMCKPGSNNYYVPAALGAVGFGVQSDDAKTVIDSIRVRGDMNAVGAVTDISIPPTECVSVAANILFRVTYGPVFGIEIVINGSIVGTLDTADFGWANLNTSGDNDWYMTPEIDVFPNAGTSGILGPYYSRATILEVSP